MPIRAKIWIDADHVTEEMVHERADPIAVVRAYCERHYETEWSDTQIVWLQTKADLKPRRFAVHIERTVNFSVSERR